MKGLWKTKLGGYIKDSRRKSCTKNQVFSDNSLYNIKHKKYNVIADEYFYFKNDRVPFEIIYGKLDDFNKLRKYWVKVVKRANKAHLRTYISKQDWNSDIKEVYGSKSVEYMVS